MYGNNQESQQVTPVVGADKRQPEEGESSTAILIPQYGKAPTSRGEWSATSLPSTVSFSDAPYEIEYDQNESRAITIINNWKWHSDPVARQHQETDKGFFIVLLLKTRDDPAQALDTYRSELTPEVLFPHYPTTKGRFTAIKAIMQSRKVGEWHPHKDIVLQVINNLYPENDVRLRAQRKKAFKLYQDVQAKGVWTNDATSAFSQRHAVFPERGKRTLQRSPAVEVANAAPQMISYALSYYNQKGNLFCGDTDEDLVTHINSFRTLLNAYSLPENAYAQLFPFSLGGTARHMYEYDIAPRVRACKNHMHAWITITGRMHFLHQTQLKQVRNASRLLHVKLSDFLQDGDDVRSALRKLKLRIVQLTYSCPEAMASQEVQSKILLNAVRGYEFSLPIHHVLGSRFANMEETYLWLDWCANTWESKSKNENPFSRW